VKEGEKIIFDNSQIREEIDQNKVNFIHQVDGVDKAWAKLELQQEEIPFYFLYSIRTDEETLNRGLAGNLLKKVNNFLEEKETPGILINFIKLGSADKDVEGLYNIYSKNGWREILGKDSDWYMFQPKNMDSKKIKKLTDFLGKKMKEFNSNNSKLE
jgi:hypothetical protein